MNLQKLTELRQQASVIQTSLYQLRQELLFFADESDTERFPALKKIVGCK